MKHVEYLEFVLIAANKNIQYFDFCIDYFFYFKFVLLPHFLWFIVNTNKLKMIFYSQNTLFDHF